ncbi:MAG: ribokinase [Actinobacteria bacterium]|nr:ribokinase [Actinomycetota bacterium]
MFDVCVVGSANLDLVATVDRLPGPGETVPGSSYREYPGGKGLNQAVAAARAGAVTAFVGAVGHDAAAEVLLGVMRDDGIDIEHVVVVDEPSGRALIVVSSAAENSIVVVAGANDAVTATTVPAARVCLAQLEVPVAAIERAFTAARAAGAITVLNPAPVKAVPDSLLALCDIVTPNEHEVELLGGVDRLRSLGARAVVVTRGAEGADLHTADGTVHVAPFAVHPVDTTGAGDCFSGVLCARLAEGDDLPTAMRHASAAAALSTTVAGAVPSLPHRGAIDAMLSGV